MYISGKRKRRTYTNKIPPPPPAFMLYSSGMDSLAKEKFSGSVGTSAVNPLSSIMDIMDSSVKLKNVHHSLANRHHSLNRSVLWRLPHRYHGHLHSHRNSANDASASTSHGKGTPLRDDKLSLKLARKSLSEYGRHADALYLERREKVSRRPDRIRSSSLVVDTVSLDVVTMVCGICQKLSKRKPCVLESMMSASDISVMAVLVCGHVYHADCLETKTSYEDRRDPPCPLCVTML